MLLVSLLSFEFQPDHGAAHWRLEKNQEPGRICTTTSEGHPSWLPFFEGIQAVAMPPATRFGVEGKNDLSFFCILERGFLSSEISLSRRSLSRHKESLGLKKMNQLPNGLRINK